MSPDMIIFWLVVGARFGIPLLIPRYPLPAIVGALILDAVDQTIFQQFTSLNLDGYQSYDKALDIYYLVIAYLSTMRNWANLFAYKMARFLIYYRLIGVALFELWHNRTLLLIFPNTFEYFFIYVEAVALRWNPIRLSQRVIVGVTAFIWIVIKLPQEYWIHVAQNDVTEMLNAWLGEPIDASIVQSLLLHPEVLMSLLLMVLGLIICFWWVITRKLPRPDWKISFSSKAHIEARSKVSSATVATQRLMVGREELIEKSALLTLVVMIFGQILPGRTSTNFQLILGVLVVVLMNALVSHVLVKQGKTFGSVVREFVVMGMINAGLALSYIFLLPSFSGGVNLTNLLFLVLLLTTLLTLYDRYRPLYEARFLAIKN